MLCSPDFGLVYLGNDPNGIRTRVTAVKGRCPGPLDDRVRKPGNIGIAIVRRKANCQPILVRADVALNVSVGDREPIRLCARFRLCVRSMLHGHFPPDAGAPHRREEACQRNARARRYHKPALRRYWKPAF